MMNGMRLGVNSDCIGGRRSVVLREMAGVFGTRPPRERRGARCLGHQRAAGRGQGIKNLSGDCKLVSGTVLC